MFQRVALVAKKRFCEVFRYSLVLRSLFSMALTARALACWQPAARLFLLCRAYGLAEHSIVWESIACAIERTCRDHSAAALDWRLGPHRHEYEQWLKSRPDLSRTTMAKAPGPGGEKGVLISYFEYNWMHLLKDPAVLPALSADFHLVLSTCWWPTDYFLIAQVLLAAPDLAVWVQPSSLDERAKFECFHSRLRTLGTLPCDWLDPSLYQPKPSKERDIDLIIVSNWAPFKRHWALFNALRDLPASLRVTCIGQPDSGSSIEDIRRLKEKLGAPQDIEFLQSLPIEEVAALQCRSHVALILSLREGCCVAGGEALMAGATLGMCRGARVGTYGYIGDQTGFHLSRRPRAQEIDQALVHAPEKQPLAFAASRLSYLASTAALNERLKAHDAATGRPWKQALAPLFWRPYPTLAHEEDRRRLAPHFAELHRRFPGVFPADMMENSHR